MEGLDRVETWLCAGDNQIPRAEIDMTVADADVEAEVTPRLASDRYTEEYQVRHCLVVGVHIRVFAADTLGLFESGLDHSGVDDFP